MKIFFLFSFIFTNLIYSEKINLVYSSSLSGNLYSCQCGLKMSVGLAKRFTFLKQNNLHKEILLDTGSSLDENFESKKAKAIYESFSKMNYTAISIGFKDLQLENIPFLESKSFPLISTNIELKTFFGNKKLSPKIKIIQKNSFKIGIVSYYSTEEIFLLNKNISPKLQFQNFESSLIEEFKNKEIQHWILLHNGSIEEAFQILEKFPKLILISQANFLKPNTQGFTERKSLKVFHTGDKLGDVLGVIQFEITKEKANLLSSKLLNMDYKTLEDDSEILEIMNKNKVVVPK